MFFFRTILGTLLVVVLGHFVNAQEKYLDQLTKEGFNAYKKKEYLIARNEFTNLIQRFPDDTFLLGLSYNMLGTIDQNEGDYSQAIQHFDQALSIYRLFKVDTLIGITLHNKGATYKTIALYDTAASFLIEALTIFEENNKPLRASQTSNLLGNVYKELGDLELALNYHNKAIEKIVTTNDSLQLAKYINNRGNTYTEMEFFDEALKSFYYALNIKKQLGDKNSQANTLYNIGDVYTRLNRIDSAIFYISQALALRKETGNKRGIAYCLNYLGHLYSINSETAKAGNYLANALTIADSLQLQDLIKENYDYQQQHFERAGNLKKSLYYFRLLTEQKEKLLNTEKQKALSELEVKYEVEKREKENELLLKENQIQALKLEKEEAEVSAWKNNFMIVTIISFLILLSAVWLLQLFRREKLLKKREQQFAIEQHHRIKNNLQVLGGILSFQHRKLEDLGAKEAIEESKNRITVMTTLHQNLYNPEVSTNSKVKLNVYLQQIADNLKLVFSREDLTIETHLSSIFISTELALPIGLIANEIVSNTLKYANNKSGQLLLTIKLTANEKNLQLLVGDNGEWITPDKNNNSVGMELIQQLIKQVDGKKQINTTNGVHYSIEIPLR